MHIEIVNTGGTFEVRVVVDPGGEIIRRFAYNDLHAAQRAAAAWASGYGNCRIDESDLTKKQNKP